MTEDEGETLLCGDTRYTAIANTFILPNTGVFSFKVILKLQNHRDMFIGIGPLTEHIRRERLIYNEWTEANPLNPATDFPDPTDDIANDPFAFDSKGLWPSMVFSIEENCIWDGTANRIVTHNFFDNDVGSNDIIEMGH